MSVTRNITGQGMTANYQAGAAKAEIRFAAEGIGMMGYGRAGNVIKGRATPLHSRAFCFCGADGASVFFAQAEICMIFPEVKRAVLERLQRRFGSTLFREDNLLIAGQHTHSGPGGFSHYPFYNFSVPGFRPPVFEGIVESLCTVLEQAHVRRQPAVLRFGQGDFPDDAPVAFNRSLAAYNRNPGVQRLAAHETQRAVERRMFLLKAETVDGRTIGQINWFGVHPTSIGNTNTLMSYDNKGYAAEYLEQAMGPGTVAIFAQQFAGDVSPNNQGGSIKGWPRGPHKDQHENARYNGRLQCEQAQRILAGLDAASVLAPGPLDNAAVNRDFSNVECDADLAGCAGERTAPPAHGLAFFGGSPVDGPGAPAAVLTLLKVAGRLVAQRARKAAQKAGGAVLAAWQATERAQAPKLIISDSANGLLLGIEDMRRIPGILDPILLETQRQYRAGALAEKPWVPAIVPLQYLRIGELAIIGFPGEITTQSGRELRTLCLEILQPAGIRQVVIASYANSYFGYCTTWHEYQEQQYEGGHTTFGSRTHDAFRTEYRRFLRECLKPQTQRRLDSVADKVFPPQVVALRTVT